MASNVFEEDDEVIASINIVPFVDIVLVLLIIFMITSSAIAKASISVDLPSAASAGNAVSSTLNVVLNAEGDMHHVPGADGFFLIPHPEPGFPLEDVDHLLAAVGVGPRFFAGGLDLAGEGGVLAQDDVSLRIRCLHQVPGRHLIPAVKRHPVLPLFQSIVAVGGGQSSDLFLKER